MMNDKSYQSNPDDRSDNVEKLQDMIENTLENIDESEAAMGLSTEEEKQMIKQKMKTVEQVLTQCVLK